MWGTFSRWEKGRAAAYRGSGHDERRMSRERTAWTFVSPALIVIGAFFALPVLAAFALSLTDFDLYALADLKNLRFIGLGNYIDILETPLFWKSLGNTLYF